MNNMHLTKHHDAGADLQLYIPRLEELGFRQRLLSDPATMAYNAPWFPPEGCIDFPESEWAAWYDRWIGPEPNRFYAYLRRKSDGCFVGEVCYSPAEEKGVSDIGIVIQAAERGNGYGRQGLRLLIARAFEADEVCRLHNVFERARSAAYQIHRALGFSEIRQERDLVYLELTREEYRSRFAAAGSPADDAGTASI